MATAREFLDYELKDNSSLFGGISFIGETLRDFIDELGDLMSYDTDMEDVNQSLNDCGIEVIPYDGMVFRGCFTSEEIAESMNCEEIDVLPLEERIALDEYLKLQTREVNIDDLIDDWLKNKRG